jgi:DNA-directed RNA polymerase subunit beta
MVKVYVAMKRKLSVGDKMAGRHGNKGVVSRILPQEDMPYFEDGTTGGHGAQPAGCAIPYERRPDPGDSSGTGGQGAWGTRSTNQLLEEQKTKALARKAEIGFSPMTPPQEDRRFDDAEISKCRTTIRTAFTWPRRFLTAPRRDEIKALLEEAGWNRPVRRPFTTAAPGKPFKEKITVGTMYMLKLHHLVDDKIHARSIGPYSLVTQQPLGGKAQFGGQRLGEMEVWAMEAYGAAHALQEFLTVKSDDMAGRTRMYEKIVKGQNTWNPDCPNHSRC